MVFVREDPKNYSSCKLIKQGKHSKGPVCKFVLEIYILHQHCGTSNKENVLSWKPIVRVLFADIE